MLYIGYLSCNLSYVWDIMYALNALKEKFMDLSGKSISELIDKALSTSCLNEMLFLQNSPSMNVRRALAKNINISSTILETLLYDPVENVSYIAAQHPKRKRNRDFENLRPCVLCEEDERGINCVDCPKVKEHSF